MNIPLTKPYFEEDDLELIRATVASGWVTQGPRVAEFEKNFSAYTGARASVAVSSCTAGLHLALLVSGATNGTEVICPSMSFIATANSISYTGAKPVFAEINSDTWNLDINHVESLITPRTKAILLVHQIGLPADIDSFAHLARRYGLRLIEDAACAVGSEYKGRKIGAHSDLVCFSFHPRKLITTGDGGMITCRDPAVEKRLRALRQHGMSVSDQARHESRTVVEEEYGEIGFNYRLTDIQAALGIRQLEKIEKIVGARREIAKIYNEALTRIPAAEILREPAQARWNYQSYPVRFPHWPKAKRDLFMQKMLDQKIATRRGIMTAHREPAYRGGGHSLPVSESVSDQSVLLPLYVGMTDAEISQVLESFTQAALSVG